MANIPQHCSMFDLDFCSLSSQTPLKQEIDDDTKQMANRFGGGHVMRGMNTRLPTLFPMMIFALMTR
jgi:hypothetical protein